jgi:hypothetical protein
MLNGVAWIHVQQNLERDVQSGNWENVIMKDRPTNDAEEYTLADLHQQQSAEVQNSSVQVTTTAAEVASPGEPLNTPLGVQQSEQGSGAGQSTAEAATSPGTAAEPSSSTLRVDMLQTPLTPSERDIGHDPFKRKEPQGSDRMELSESALADPLTRREGDALAKHLGQSKDVDTAAEAEKQARMDSMKGEASKASTAFMNGLARNVGLGIHDKDKANVRSARESSSTAAIFDNAIDNVVEARDAAQAGRSSPAAAASARSAGSAASDSSASTSAEAPLFKLVTDIKVCVIM